MKSASNNFCTSASPTNLFSSPKLLFFGETGIASLQTESLCDITRWLIPGMSSAVQANKSLLSVSIFFILWIPSLLKHPPRRVFYHSFPSCHNFMFSLVSTLISLFTMLSQLVITTILWFTCRRAEVTVGVNLRLVT